MTNRRNFLKLSAFSIGSLGLFDTSNNSAFAAIRPGADDYKSLVVINLNGGNDSLNMLIPNTQAEYDLYAQARSNIAFNKSDLLPITPSGYGIDSFAFSPRMPEARDLFNNGDLSFIANVGSLVEPITKSQFLDLSKVIDRPVGIGGHNTQAAYWQADHSNRIDTSKEGWGGRLANEFDFESDLPINISLNSGHTVFQSHSTQKFYDVGLGGLLKMRDFSINDSTKPGIRARRKAINDLNQLASESPNFLLKHAGQLFSEGLDLNLLLQTSLSTVTEDFSVYFPAPVSSNGGSFSQALARVAELIKARRQLGMKRQIFFLEQSGYDTHSDHANRHGNLSEDLSKYLKAFNDIISGDDEIANSVVTMTTSEFGRNLASNGDGTDHAWGAQHMVMGGPIDGGKIFGTYPSLVLGSSDDNNKEGKDGVGRMIPTLSIAQYGATIAKWFGVPDSDLSSVFPNIDNFAANQRDIGFII